MKIINLIENTKGHEGCAYAHGLSFYVETTKHKLLLDLGPSEETLHNADKLGVYLKEVDTVILSHGHYDHSGYYIIDVELELFTIKQRSHALPFTNNRLLIKESDGFARDNFLHEQYLVIRDGKTRILLSGCAHNGMLSILDAFRDKYGVAPDVAISGFHLMKKTEYSKEEIQEITDIGNELKKYSTHFITCHCTGEPAYEIMKLIMGEQLQYVHCGEEVNWRNDKYRN